ncbi:galactosyltransferase-domain-containing protein [Mortierella sp. GBAus27b]|nr:galactosyltransferase-domain-containing protein [Mortierella sp. GBAus27b]
MTSSALDNYVGVLWRWFVNYEPRPAMIRLFTLGTLYWFSVVYFVSYFGEDEPIWPWMVICAILAVMQTIQILHFRVKGHYELDGKDKPIRNSKPLIYWRVLIPGGIVSFVTMVMLLYQNSTRLSTAEAIATRGATGMSATTDARLVIGAAQVQVLILIMSSWSPKALQRRNEIRETTLKLAPQSSSRFAYTYRFVLSEAPSSHARNTMGVKINNELRKHEDILFLPVPDSQEELGVKVFKALEWSNKFKFDFLCKTNDDVFVRWDTIAEELMTQGPSHYYWRGLTFRNMKPIVDPDAKLSNDEAIGIFPTFVADTLYILSRDLVTLLTYPGPRMFTGHEDQNIGVWLHPFNINPVHDRRIQQWDVCEDDMIAKRFGTMLKPLESMHDMYNNIAQNKPLCNGFRQNRCAMCYSCINRDSHWKDQGLGCDSVHGISLLKAGKVEVGLAGDIKDAVPSLGRNPKWIITGVLSDTSSVYSDTDEWDRLHWALWTTDPATTWSQRHYQAIESLFVHNPSAVLIVLSNTLPPTFFADYTRQGYQIHIRTFSKELLLQWGWFIGKETQDWINSWDTSTPKSAMFSTHLEDYLRLIIMYKYGGLFMDIGTIWVKAPGDSITEFIGSDVSDDDSDLEWTLDDKNTYLTNSVMRFKRGRSMFRKIANNAFTIENYNPNCLNCGGSKALTTYIKPRRASLEKTGLRILPRTVLYPYSRKEIPVALRKSEKADELVLQLEERGLSIYLQDKVTSRNEVEDGSVIAAALNIWSLGLSSDTVHRGTSSPRLQGSKRLYYDVSSTNPVDSLLTKAPGEFKGIDAVFVRGGQYPGELRKAVVQITVQTGAVAIRAGGEGSRKIHMDLGDSVSMAGLNLILSRIRYIPPAEWTPSDVDLIAIQVQFGTMREQLDIPVIQRPSKLHS